MDFTLWKSILLDWANSTGYLVKNYENLSDINIEAFFQEFVRKIDSVKPRSPNIIDFVKDYYPEFHLKVVQSDNNNGEKQVHGDEYVYVYSMLLHYSCVRYPDKEMQNVCSGLLEKYQTIVAKYFDFMHKAVKHTREIIQDAIEEAESFVVSGPFVSPLNRSFSVFSNKEVPSTPRTSKLLDSWNNDNRNLKAQLETERFERGYLEMQVKHNEEKLAKYDADHKKAMAEINDLKKHITALMEEIATPNKSKADPMVKRLRKNIDEMEDELVKYTQNVNELSDSNALLSSKIQYAEKQIQMLTAKTLDLQDDMDKLNEQLEDRENVIKLMTETNKQQEELIKELRRSVRSEDGRSEESRLNESSYEVLDSTSTSNNTSFVFPEENLAQAVVDVRLLDQQRQNAALIETVERLTNELDTLRKVINDLFAELSQQEALPEEVDVLSDVSRLLRETLRKNEENVSRLASQEAELKELRKLNEQNETDAEALAVQLKQTDEKMSRERISHDEQMAILQSKIQQAEESLAAMKAEHEKLNILNAERSAELKKVEQSLENSIGERDVLQSKLLQLETELKDTNETLQTKSAEVLAQMEAKDSLQIQLHEVNAKVAETEETLQTQTDRADKLAKEKAELVDRLKETEQLIVALNGEIMEAQHVAASQQQALAEKQAKIDQSEESIAQLEKDNLSLAHARAKAQESINELDDLVKSQSKQLEQQQAESAQKLESCAQKSNDLKMKLNAAKVELIATEETMKAKSEEVSQLEQKITTMAEKHSTEIEDQQSKHGKALAEIESLRLKLNELQTELTTSTQIQATSRKEIDALLKEKLVFEEKEKETDTTINKLNDELVAAKLAHENELTKLKESEAERKRMEELIKQLTDEKNGIEAEIHRLNQLQSESEDKIAALEVKVTDLHAEKEALSKIIELNANEQSALNTKMEQLTQASSDAEQRFVSELKTAEDRIKELNAAIERHSAAQEQLQSDLAIATDRNIADASQMADLTSEVSKLTASEETLRLENVKLNEAKTAAQTLAQEMADKLDAANKSIADCEAKIEEFAIQKAELEAQAADFNERLSAIGVTLSESQDKCLELHSEMDKIRLDNEKKTEELNAQYAEEKARFEREIDELINKRDSIDAELQLERDKLATEKASFELKIHELTEEKIHKESEANMLFEKVDSLTAELAHMKLGHLEELNKVRSEAAEREATLQREKEQFEVKLSQLESEIEQITSKFEQLEKVHSENFAQLEAETAERIENIIEEKQGVEEALAAMKLEIERVNKAIEEKKTENATFVKEKNALVTKVIELNRTIDDQQQQLAESKAYAEKMVGELKSEKQLSQERFDKVETNHKEDLANLRKELADSVTKIEQLEQENVKIQSELSNLQEENKLLVVATTNTEQLNALKSQIAHLQKKQHDSHDNWVKEREAMMQDVKIFKAKLMKERELADAKAKEHDQQVTEVRHEFEEKLEKMKDKMKTLYSAEMSKVKAKHEVELMERATEMQRYVDKIEQYEDRFKKLSNQLHVKNDQHLTLLKENEIMKSKMRSLESQTTFSSMKPNVPSSFMDRLRAGGSFKNEDEPEEMFSEKYLEDLKNGGSILMAGRDSISVDEIQRRNSMVPAHLRSSYSMQYQNQNLNDVDDSMFKIDDDQKAQTLDDSMLSTQSDTRRGTLYKRPGPPTPSKNAGRISIGGTNAELPRGDILRESNKSTKSASKKSTPGKTLLSMFTTAKVKDEMENYDPNVLNQLIVPAKFEFSTSTPQRRLAKMSMPGKFDALSSFCNWENSLSFLRTTETAVYDSHQAITRPSIELTRIEEAMLQPMLNDSATLKRGGRKMKNNRRRRTSSVEATYKRPAKNEQQTNKRREKRIDAFSRCRKLIEEEQISAKIKSNNATFVIDDESENETDVLDESYIERCELVAFHKEIDRMKISSLINSGDDFPINENDENTNFEQLCHTKMSEHPYVEANPKVSTMRQDNSNSNASDSVEVSSGKLEIEENNNNSASPSCSPNTAKMNGHCANPMYLHPHKIPQIVRHKSLARINLSSENNTSAYNKMHPFMKIYLVGISVAFFGILMYLVK